MSIEALERTHEYRAWKSYERANFSPLHESVYGIGIHWAHWTSPYPGEKRLSYQEAVARFDVAGFVAQIRETGAGHVLFTLAHDHFHLPCPSAVMDGILQGRTSQRDLVMELADQLAGAGIKLMLYLGHCTHHDNDPAWKAAVGGNEPSRAAFYQNLIELLVELGQRYGEKVIGWWIDGCRCLVRQGLAPWPVLTQAAKIGHPHRLIAYNDQLGLNEFHVVSCYQDFPAGEGFMIDTRPSGGQTCQGFPWYQFTTWHAPEGRDWGHWGLGDPEITFNAASPDQDWPAPEPARIMDYIQAFHQHGGCVTFNLFCWQNGRLYDPDFQAMTQVGRMLHP